MNAICAGLLYFIPFWSTFAIFSGFFLFIFTVIYVIRHFFETQLFSWRAESCNFRDWWSEFPDKLQDFYNRSKIVCWLELYNIKHPINNIKLQQQQINSEPIERNNGSFFKSKTKIEPPKQYGDTELSYNELKKDVEI